MLGLLPFLLIFVIFYFLILRPQSKQQKERAKMIGQLKQGDSVVTIGGVHGTIAGIREKDNTLIIKVADNLKLTVDRSAVNRVVGKDDGAK